MKNPFIFTIAVCWLSGALFAEEKSAAARHERALVNDYYQVETIATPKGLSTEVGGIAFMPDGRLVATFHHGEVYMYDPAKKAWKLFADGLHDPLGVAPISDREIVVMQRPELTRITDTDGDGVADQFDTITDAFGMSGNYHEFAFGPLRAKDGSLFVALNVGSNGAGLRSEIRGELSKLSGPDARMYSAVPYRGWILRISPEGKMEPWALGFRSPNGLGFDADENLYVPDNQGDWIGTSPLYKVEKGKFYGHPASLAWKEGTTTAPVKMPVTELAAMKTYATIAFPHNLMANSPTQPLLIKTGGKFGPFEGQMIIGEMNRARLIRVIFDDVDGQRQGACVPLLDDGGLLKGNNRLAFAKDGSLWVGQTDHGWAGDKGLQRISWTGKTPLDLAKIKLTAKGFDLTFTRPVAASGATSPTAYKVRRYYYEYHSAYGSKQYDLQEITVSGATLSKDRKTVSLELPELTAWRIYELHLDELKTDDGTPILNPLVCYTLNHLLENTPEPPAPGVSTKISDQ